MLSEINLLPTREKRSPFFMITLAIILSIGLIGTVLLYMQYQYVSKEQTMKESEGKVIAKLIEEETAKLMLAQSQTEIQQYEQIVQTVTRLPLQTVNILDDLIAALPKSGYISTYMYQDNGMIDISVDFGNLEDAAQYLHELIYAEWVETVEANEVKKYKPGELDIQGPYNGSYTIQLRRDVFSKVEGDEVK